MDEIKTYILLRYGTMEQAYRELHDDVVYGNCKKFTVEQIDIILDWRDKHLIKDTYALWNQK